MPSQTCSIYLFVLRWWDRAKFLSLIVSSKAPHNPCRSARAWGVGVMEDLLCIICWTVNMRKKHEVTKCQLNFRQIIWYIWCSNNWTENVFIKPLIFWEKYVCLPSKCVYKHTHLHVYFFSFTNNSLWFTDFLENYITLTCEHTRRWCGQYYTWLPHLSPSSRSQASIYTIITAELAAAPSSETGTPSFSKRDQAC